MSEAERLALATQLQDHRDAMRRLALDLAAARSHRAANARLAEQIASAQILQLRIKIALIESQLAAA